MKGMTSYQSGRRNFNQNPCIPAKRPKLQVRAAIAEPQTHQHSNGHVNGNGNGQPAIKQMGVDGPTIINGQVMHQTVSFHSESIRHVASPLCL